MAAAIGLIEVRILIFRIYFLTLYGISIGFAADKGLHFRYTSFQCCRPLLVCALLALRIVTYAVPLVGWPVGLLLA